ncbi:MAG: AMP-binding protein [Hyphomicrobiales bacterium]
MVVAYILLVCVLFFALTYWAWIRYLWAAEEEVDRGAEVCPYSLTDVFGENHLLNVPHQVGIEWLSDVFSRSAAKYPDFTALQIPHTGEALTFAELDANAKKIAAAVAPYLTGPDQVVAVSMSQDNWQIVATHLGVLKAGGVLMFLDATLPDALTTHMLDDAQPVVVVTRGQDEFRDLPTLDVMNIPDDLPPAAHPAWLDDPKERLATIFYTSGTTGKPKGVECPHAGYVNLALTYADYFDLAPGMDATSLTSSLGYDGSISEMYSAWVSGCAVVMLTKEQLRSGPDLVPVLREAEVTMLFCPPVLLTTLTPNPELDLPYPICRYIVPAGEAFPNALVEPWTRCRRQVINTYGPTEASTDTSRQSLRPGEPVTIGSPFANVTYVILEEGGIEPLLHGEVGELCIGGVHVGRGYRNLPEQTEQKFIEHLQFGRLYRTGDRCRIDIKAQQVHFLGRVDSQLKVRGHRVEIQPVEDILQTQFDEIEAAILDYQNEELVAFVAAPSVSQGKSSSVTPAPVQWEAQVKTTLASQLPEPSVPTRIFLFEKFVMKPTSGKIDRERLPDLSEHFENGRFAPDNAAEDTPASAPGYEEIEVGLPAGADEVLAICKNIFGAHLGWDGVFAENGGHSISIARLAQKLHASGRAVPVRALLSDCNTARKIAERPPQEDQPSTAALNAAVSRETETIRDEHAAEVLSPHVFTIQQVLFLSVLYLPHLAGFLAVVAFSEIGKFFMTASLLEYVGAGLGVYMLALVLPFANIGWVFVVKLFMFGHISRNNLAPGVYPKWSKMHFRVWCIGRLENSVLIPARAMFRSAPLLAFVLRRLGASVGANLQCAPDAEFSGPLDLLLIGDDVAIQTGAYVHLSMWKGQELHIGPIELDSGCKIGLRAAVGPDAVVGSGTWITPFTPILHSVGPGEIWEGAPAKFVGRTVSLKRSADSFNHQKPDWIPETANIIMQILIEFWLVIFPTAVVTWVTVKFIPASETEIASQYFKVMPLSEIVWQMGLFAFITAWVSVVLVSVLGCLFLRFTAASPGLYSSRGLMGCLLLYRLKKINQIQRQWTWTLTGQYLRALAGLRYARLGASECDVMFNLVPDMATAGSQVFWSNGCFTNMLDYGAEHVRLRQLDMGHNFFTGNNCVAEAGHFPSNFLLGVSTMGNDIQFRRQMLSRDGEQITVVGNPPIKIPSAEIDADYQAERLPTFRLFLARILLNDTISIGFLPITYVIVYVILYTVLLRMDVHPVAGAFGALILSEFSLVLLCAALKLLLVGKNWGANHATPFWSWRHFTYFFVQDCFYAWCRIPLGFLAGTLLSNIILRWMGCKIGARTLVVSPMQASDWNAVNFGDDCLVAGFLQYHTMEDLMLKVKQTRIGDGGAVNFGATIMGGAEIEPETTLMPLSMVLKEMYLNSAVYEGSPAAPVTALSPPFSVAGQLDEETAGVRSPGKATEIFDAERMEENAAGE